MPIEPASPDRYKNTMDKYQVRTIKAVGRVNGPSALTRIEAVLEQLRLLHNACLQQYQAAEANHDPKRFDRYSQQKELTELRAEDQDYARVIRRLQESVIHNMAVSWKKYASGDSGKPRYKTGRYRTIALDSPQGKVMRFTSEGNGMLQISSLPAVRLLSTQEIPQDRQPVAARITLKGRQIAVRLSYRFGIAEKGEPTEAVNPVGVDLGIVLSMATSNGHSYRSPKQEYLERQVKKARGNLSHIIAAAMATGQAGYVAVLDDSNKQVLSKKGRPMRRLTWTSGQPTKSYLKARRRLSELTDKLAMLRREFRHRITTTIVDGAQEQNNDLLAIEDLQVRNMSASAQGTESHPGRNVRAKSGLNRSILREAWGETLLMLEYKAERAGIPSVRVGAQGTSTTCSLCGHRDLKSRRSQAVFQCTDCGHQANADFNASVNIADRGMIYFQKRKGLTLDDLRLARRALRPSGGAESPETGPAGQPASQTSQESPINASKSGKTGIPRPGQRVSQFSDA